MLDVKNKYVAELVKLYQDIKYGRGSDSDDVYELNVGDSEYWDESDSELIESLSLEKLEENGMRYVLGKRAFSTEWGDIVIPQGEVALGVYLAKLAKLYWRCRDEGNYDSYFTKLMILRMEICKRLFSKSFPEKYKFRMPGVSGVILTHGRSWDEILVPEWCGIPLNSLVLFQRDPVQGIAVCLRVTGYTRNEVRVNGDMLEKLLGGDCDGDKGQFSWVKELYDVNREYFECTYTTFLKVCDNMRPSLELYNDLLA